MQGTCYPLLVVGWGGTEIINKMTRKKATQKGAFRILIITALIAKRILAKSHVYRLTWLSDENQVLDVSYETQVEMTEFSGHEQIRGPRSSRQMNDDPTAPPYVTEHPVVLYKPNEGIKIYPQLV